MGKLACMALLAVGCTTANPAFEDANADADAGTRGDEGTITTSSTDTGSDGEGSATAGSAATSDASAGDSSGGSLECPEACGDNASCVDAGSGPACACDPGFEGDGSECVPVPTLEPVMWQLGCMGNSESCPGVDVCAPEAPMDVHEVERSATASLMGDPATIYEVKLHLRGVVEPKVYDGGDTNEHWNEGGMPVPDGWNVAYLELQDPPRLIYVNAGPPLARYCMALDHELVVRMRGGSMLEIGATDANNCMIVNIDAPGGEPISLPDIDEPAQPFAGQFMRVEAVSITAQ